MILYSCPMCGKPESSYDGETFCGQCEQEYRESEYNRQQAEIAEVQAKLAEHNRDHPDCEGCATYFTLAAKLAFLNGDEERGISLLNQ